MTAGLTSRLEWHGDRVLDEVREATADGMLVALEFLLTEANQGVPIDEHMLEASGVATIDERKLEGAVSYDTPYAVRQHEDMTFRHAPGRHAKWLELAALRNQRNMANIVATQIRRRVAQGGDGRA